MKEMHDFSIGYIKRKGQAIPPCAYENNHMIKEAESA